MPPGYTEEDHGQEGLRTAWTPDPVEVKPSTRTTSNLLKYSSAEMLARGEKAADIAQGRTEHQSVAAITRELRQLGVKGKSMFSVLSYFKCVCLGCSIPCRCIRIRAGTACMPHHS